MYLPRIPHRIVSVRRCGGLFVGEVIISLGSHPHIHPTPTHTHALHTHKEQNILKINMKVYLNVRGLVVQKVAGLDLSSYRRQGTSFQLGVDLSYLSFKFINKCHFPLTNTVRTCLHSLANTSPHTPSPKYIQSDYSQVRVTSISSLPLNQ